MLLLRAGTTVLAMKFVYKLSSNSIPELLWSGLGSNLCRINGYQIIIAREPMQSQRPSSTSH